MREILGMHARTLSLSSALPSSTSIRQLMQKGAQSQTFCIGNFQAVPAFANLLASISASPKIRSSSLAWLGGKRLESRKEYSTIFIRGWSTLNRGPLTRLEQKSYLSIRAASCVRPIILPDCAAISSRCKNWNPKKRLGKPQMLLTRSVLVNTKKPLWSRTIGSLLKNIFKRNLWEQPGRFKEDFISDNFEEWTPTTTHSHPRQE